MSSAALKKILEEAPKSLLPDEQRQLREATVKLQETAGSEKPTAVLWFLLAAGLVHFLEKRNAVTHDERRQLHDLLNQGAIESGLISRADIVREVRGKYAHLMTSSDTFAAQKQEEIRLEER